MRPGTEEGGGLHRPLANGMLFRFLQRDDLARAFGEGFEHTRDLPGLLEGSFCRRPLLEDGAGEFVDLVVVSEQEKSLVVVRTFSGNGCRFKPFMFVAAMIYHQIHEYFDLPVVQSFKQRIKIFHVAKFFHNTLIVRDIVPVIFVGRRVNRIEPDHIYTQAG